jgi:hypothetical protein
LNLPAHCSLNRQYRDIFRSIGGILNLSGGDKWAIWEIKVASGSGLIGQWRIAPVRRRAEMLEVDIIRSVAVRAGVTDASVLRY